MVTGLGEKSAILIEDPGQTARHARTEVLAGRAEHRHQSTRHVLAAVVADAFDHRERSGVTHGEAFAGAASGKERATGCPVESHVAENDVQFAFPRGTALAAENQFSAA